MHVLFTQESSEHVCFDYIVLFVLIRSGVNTYSTLMLNSRYSFDLILQVISSSCLCLHPHKTVNVPGIKLGYHVPLELACQQYRNSAETIRHFKLALLFATGEGLFNQLYTVKKHTQQFKTRLKYKQLTYRKLHANPTLRRKHISTTLAVSISQLPLESSQKTRQHLLALNQLNATAKNESYGAFS